MKKKPKVIVIGLDGGTWDIIKPLVERGKLPTIEKLMKNGTYGNLESSIPPGTFPAWKCYSTGKNPGKIGGIVAYIQPDLDKQDVILNDSSSFKGEEIWEILNKHQFTCGVLNMPGTFPPKKIDNFIVSQALHKTTNYTYPKELEKELINKFNYEIHPRYTYFIDKDKTISDCKEIVNMRFNVGKYLIENYKPDLFHITIFYTDHIQHYYWKYMDEGDEKYSFVIEDFWKLIDNKIKNLLKDFKNSYVMLMSDHGFVSVDAEFNMLKWLVDNNYTTLSNKVALMNKLNKFGISLENLMALMNKFKIHGLLNRIISRDMQMKLLAYLPSKTGIIRADFGKEIKELLDWRKSKIIPIAGIRINKNVLSLENIDYKEFRDRFINKLKNIKSPNGYYLFKKIYKREEIYKGEYISLAPDILFIFNNNPSFINVKSINMTDNLWDFSKSNWSGKHNLHGIFCISGPGIKKNQEIKNAKIIDLAPTILHLFNVSIPNDIDGRVLKECFEEDSKLAKREIVFQDVEKIENLKNRIKKLKIEGKI